MSSEPYPATVHRAWAADLDPATLYALLRLRVDVFVVEQRCPYSELDGRDLEAETRHYWLTGNAEAHPVLGCLRLLVEPGGEFRVGRLCLDQRARGRGLGRRLMDAVLAEVGEDECVADVQAPLVDFYQGYGFVPAGDRYDWAGVEHAPMRRAKRGPGQ